MFTLPDLPYPYNALEPSIDEATMRIHHDRHHAAYVDNLNKALEGLKQYNNITIEQLLQNLNQVPEGVRTKVRNHGGGHANHSLFWLVMAKPMGGGRGQPSGELAKAIDSTFGSFSQFQEKFSAAGMGRFGSGWVWLITDGGNLAIADTPNQDTPLTEGKTPVLGLDVWEHAYYLKYQNQRAEYVKNWWYVVNWSEVERRYMEAIK